MKDYVYWNQNPDELYHYGRKGMKWYQHIFSDVRDRMRANRTARMTYKIARVKEKMRLAEEKAKLRQFKAKEKQSILDAKKKEASDKQALKAASDRPKAPTVDKSTIYSMGASDVFKNAKFMTNNELVYHITRLTNEKTIRELANTDYSNKHKATTFLKKQLSNSLGIAVKAVIDYGQDRAIKMVLDSLSKRTLTGGAQ